ncbi:hypothetical protein O7627_36720 [Solwaraspora sp. WMMD1047]|uniref:hypothetical protein n=1 Tax=Solwaraspora sp. WMMD1047 TaxID=3016102 RepID=UPI0024177805|nr:hypothetical protein [Solwaraspora sp. WMMD1047]MDG4834814.1 hypothetical protein [Solwaraspora sp. WMMD1047]
MSGWDVRQAVMVVANMVESLLQGESVMAPSSKITSSHLSRLAIVYLRQSSMAQVRQNTESTARQYGLATTAAELGWLAEQIIVVDADLVGLVCWARWSLVRRV